MDQKNRPILTFLLNAILYILFWLVILALFTMPLCELVW